MTDRVKSAQTWSDVPRRCEQKYCIFIDWFPFSEYFKVLMFVKPKKKKSLCSPLISWGRQVPLVLSFAVSVYSCLLDDCNQAQSGKIPSSVYWLVWRMSGTDTISFIIFSHLPYTIPIQCVLFCFFQAVTLLSVFSEQSFYTQHVLCDFPSMEIWALVSLY